MQVEQQQQRVRPAARGWQRQQEWHVRAGWVPGWERNKEATRRVGVVCLLNGERKATRPRLRDRCPRRPRARPEKRRGLRFHASLSLSLSHQRYKFSNGVESGPGRGRIGRPAARHDRTKGARRCPSPTTSLPPFPCTRRIDAMPWIRIGVSQQQEGTVVGSWARRLVACLRGTGKRDAELRPAAVPRGSHQCFREGGGD